MIRYIKFTTLLSIFSIGSFFLLNYLYPLNVDRLNKPQSTLIFDRKNHLITVKLSSDGFLRIPILVNELTPQIKDTLLAYEDQYFEHHFGINPLAIVRALWFNLTHQKRIGASTITMQVARMMHHERRTFGQKLIEMFQSLQLELNYSKEEILTFYLNNAPYGGNVEGFASASFRYFNLSASSLSLSQIAYLTAIPKNPNANRPKKDRDILVIKNRLLKRIYNLKLLKKSDYLRAKEERIVTDIRNLPHHIPHLSAQTKQEGSVYTTIDMRLQTKVEQIVASQVKDIREFDIHNGVALVIDNQTMEIIAYVGSNNFYDSKYGGQNDGIRALVSPGSTLKPLVYAKALEEGLITPLKKIYDVPLFINGYKPTNYAKEYLGEVTATEALQLSLNIPAVELDRLLGEKSLYHILNKANISSILHPKHYYGSALTLGGFGISLKENAELFAMLANGGVYQKSKFLKESEASAPNRYALLTPQSTYLISTILSDSPRLSFSSSWEYMKNMPRIAFKTGTSAHAKDMLTIGYTPNYTVAVWYGNFSGKESKSHQKNLPTGLKIASPTMFKIFNELGVQAWFRQPNSITKKRICQDSIKIGECQEWIEDKIIEEVKRETPCQAMRAEVLSYLLQSKKIESFSKLSTHHCYKEWKSYKPLITNPVHHKTYAHNQMLPQEFKKTMMQCYSFEDNTTIYWLIDNDEPVVGESSVPFYKYLTPQKHTISCLDEGAKMQNIEVYLEEI
ncbi:MAG: penicillin-binding protein 1C [Sulfurovaceae bacterium]|nr:penicillin-binding protein 1C [Sulfurovaceae bacterium]